VQATTLAASFELLNSSLLLLAPELWSSKDTCDPVVLAKNARNLPDMKEVKLKTLQFHTQN